MEPPAPFDSGEIARRLPGYRLLRTLGRGGMGVVYLAEETALNRLVAVKVLPQWQAEDEEFRWRFLNEPEMAAALEHPNIVPIHRAEDADGLLYIVMRYIDGPSLTTLLKAEGPLGLGRAIAILRQAAAALDAAHAAGLIHRDVKPANILLDRDRRHVYLCDFGIAKRLGADGGITATGTFVGTLPYASPEQIQGQRLDGRADLYALGCVLYRCLTGTVPYDQVDPRALMWAHLTADPPRLSDRRPELPAAVDAVIATALAKDPQDRYATGGDLIAALETAATGSSPDPPTRAGAAQPAPDPPTRAGAAQPTPDPVPAVPALSDPAPLPSAAAPSTPLTPVAPGRPERPTGRGRRRGVLASLPIGLALVAAVVTVWHRGSGTGDGIGPALAPGHIVSIAGTAVPSGDGAAADAVLNDPRGIVFDAAGSLYFADSERHRVHRIDSTGRISTVAGTGEPGYSGDGGPAIDAALNTPADVAVDRAGSLYIAEAGNDVIRRVDPTGTIATIAGSSDTDAVGDGGPATGAGLNTPRGLTADAAGNLYIAEEDGHRVRRIDPRGVITTIAGTGEPGYSGDGGPAAAARLNDPEDVAADLAGNLYVADRRNHRVRRIDPRGVITTIAGDGIEGASGDGGPAAAARLNDPMSVAVDAAGSLAITDQDNHRIRRIDPAGTITTIAGTGVERSSGDRGAAVNATLNFPSGVAISAMGDLAIAESGSQRIRRIDPRGRITTIAGASRLAADGPAEAARLYDPTGVAMDPAGSLYFAEWRDHRIRRIDPEGRIATIAGTGEPGYSGDGGLALNAMLDTPADVAIDADGSLYVADESNHRIRRIDPRGVITTIAGTGEPGYSGDGGPAAAAQLKNPLGIAVDRAGNLLIAEWGSHRIRRIDPRGVITTIAGTGEPGYSGDGGAAAAAMLNAPTDVAAGPDGSLYVADESNQRIRKIDPEGRITTIAGTGEPDYSSDGGAAAEAALNDPEDVVAAADGALYIADRGNHRVRRIDPHGVITTIAGTGTRGFSGDGGPAVNAALDLPNALALDRWGSLYIAEGGNDRIRKVKL